MGHHCTCKQAFVSDRSTDLLHDQDYYNLEPQEVVVYNRVSKCGSSNFLALVRDLASTHLFHWEHSKVMTERHLNETQQKAVVDLVRGLKSPALFDRHFHMVNFTK